MDWPILVGIETEYGFTVENRSVHDQVDDAISFVRSYPGEAFLGWDYRLESPRSDLRGFKVEALTYDPIDAQFDSGKSRPPAAEERSDRILPNGARFYNDHGHPEYATPECFTPTELALHDLLGQQVVLSAARAFAKSTNQEVKVYKNNTDFHGASYGTHESYLVPRKYGFPILYPAITPLLIARQVVTGAGKVGSESGGPARFQLTQRADFFTEPHNLETLYRRPVFNTRDEPHADPENWIRLHVICGDANMMPACTKRKVGLVQIALALLAQDRVPNWEIPDPARSFKLVSRDQSGEGRIELENNNWTTPRQVLESYCESYLQSPEQTPELTNIANETLALLDQRHSNPDEFRRHVDWAAKHWLIDQFRESENLNWSDPSLQSFDLAYTLLDSEQGLYSALVQAGEVAWHPSLEEFLPLLDSPPQTRAYARSHAIKHFSSLLTTAAWARLTFNHQNKTVQADLQPNRTYQPLNSSATFEEFLEYLNLETK